MSGLKERLKRSMSCEYWVAAYRRRNNGSSLLQEERIEGFTRLPGKRFVTQADPFLYEHQGRTWLFYEKQNLTDMKGTLWCLNLDDAQAKPQPVLTEDFHLSYPQIFQYGRYTYMLPETRQAKEVRLYQCRQFPSKWEKVETLFLLPAVDTTILKSENMQGSCYAFAYVQDHLEIYLCELEKEHFRIVKKEKLFESEPSKEMRPGGAFFKEDGKLFRPVQNCTDYYGQELIIRRVDALTDGAFSETEYCRLSPEQVEIPGICAKGIHTYNQTDRYEVIDILHEEKSLFTILKKLYWKLLGMRK